MGKIIKMDDTPHSTSTHTNKEILCCPGIFCIICFCPALTCGNWLCYLSGNKFVTRGNNIVLKIHKDSEEFKEKWPTKRDWEHTNIKMVKTLPQKMLI